MLLSTWSYRELNLQKWSDFDRNNVHFLPVTATFACKAVCVVNIMSVLDLTGHSFFGVRHQVSFTSCDSHVTSHDPSLSITAPKLNYTILYNSSRALKFQQLIFGSPDKPDGRVGKREGGVSESHPNTHTVLGGVCV